MPFMSMVVTTKLQYSIMERKINVDMSVDNEYNQTPVEYCPICLGLDIRTVDGIGDIEYCTDCGNTATETATIFEWREMYRVRYGHFPEVEPKIDY